MVTAVEKLKYAFGDDNITAATYRDEVSITVPKENIVEIMQFLRDDPALRFDLLKDVFAVDWFRPRDRFEVLYNLWSLENNVRVRICALIDEREPHIDSICEVYPAANWFERETYDMHGIIFDNHPDLRRMYMPEDMVDPITGEALYPLRKDFPMMGVPGSLPLPEK